MSKQSSLQFFFGKQSKGSAVVRVPEEDTSEEVVVTHDEFVAVTAEEVEVVSDEGDRLEISDEDGAEARAPSSKRDRKFQTTWLNDFDWLEYHREDTNEYMTCKFCSARPLIAGKTDFTKASKTFKRETLVSHSRNKRHLKCRDSVLGSKDVAATAIGKGIVQQITSARDREKYELSVKMNTAYMIAKEELSFTKMESLVLLQKKNGLDVSATYDNDVRCAELISTISKDLEVATTNAVNSARYMAIMVDGATDVSVHENEAIYVSTVVTESFTVKEILACSSQHLKGSTSLQLPGHVVGSMSVDGVLDVRSGTKGGKPQTWTRVSQGTKPNEDISSRHTQRRSSEIKRLS